MGLLDIGVKKAAPITAADLASTSGADNQLVGMLLSRMNVLENTHIDSASHANVGRYGNI